MNREDLMLIVIIVVIGVAALLATRVDAGMEPTPTSPLIVHYMCDVKDCAGEMMPHGMVLLSNPPQYPHRCTVCKIDMTFDIMYPYIKYVDKTVYNIMPKVKLPDEEMK